jgi:hypothetical protein
VVTAHDSVGLPSLYATRVDVTLATRVVAALIGDDELLAGVDFGAMLRARAGDLRAVLFDLYDVHESRRRAAATSP